MSNEQDKKTLKKMRELEQKAAERSRKKVDSLSADEKKKRDKAADHFADKMQSSVEDVENSSL